MPIVELTLHEVFARAYSGTLPRGWLYLPSDEGTWGESTRALMIDADDADDPAEPVDFRGIADDDTLDQLVHGAEQLFGELSFKVRLRLLKYWDRFDSFPETVDAPDPPTGREGELAHERRFHAQLSPERPDVPCRADGCKRGAVRFSVMCARHQCEQVWRRPCLLPEA